MNICARCVFACGGAPLAGTDTRGSEHTTNEILPASPWALQLHKTFSKTVNYVCVHNVTRVNIRVYRTHMLVIVITIFNWSCSVLQKGCKRFWQQIKMNSIHLLFYLISLQIHVEAVDLMEEWTRLDPFPLQTKARCCDSPVTTGFSVFIHLEDIYFYQMENDCRWRN